MDATLGTSRGAGTRRSRWTRRFATRGARYSPCTDLIPTTPGTDTGAGQCERSVRLPAALGGGRRPERRRHRPPAADHAGRRRGAAGVPRPAVRADAVLPLLRALPADP